MSYRNGILVDNFIFLVTDKRLPSNKWKPWVQLYRLPASHNEPLVHLASFELPGRPSTRTSTPRPDLDVLRFSTGTSVAHDRLDFASAPTQLLEVTFSATHAYVLASDLLSDAIVTRPASAPPLHLRWSVWSHKMLFIVSPRKPVPFAVVGAHVVCRDEILDFNRYDTADDVYGRAEAKPRSKKSKPLAESTIVNPAASPAAFGRPYRVTPLAIPGLRIAKVLWVAEESDGPKVRDIFVCWGAVLISCCVLADRQTRI